MSTTTHRKPFKADLNDMETKAVIQGLNALSTCITIMKGELDDIPEDITELTHSMIPHLKGRVEALLSGPYQADAERLLWLSGYSYVAEKDKTPRLYVGKDHYLLLDI